MDCPWPVEKLPSWVRPWPVNGNATDHMQWLGEFARGARAAGRDHVAEYAACRMLEIGYKITSESYHALETRCQTLEARLAEKINTVADEIAEAAYNKLSARLTADVDQRLRVAVRKIELRFSQQAAFESSVLLRVGQLSKGVDELETRCQTLEWRNG